MEKKANETEAGRSGQHSQCTSNNASSSSSAPGPWCKAAGIPPSTFAAMPSTSSTAGPSSEAPLAGCGHCEPAQLGQNVLPDRAKELNLFAKSKASKSKRQEFKEKHGYQKGRGGQCREYFAHQWGRDP